MSVTKKRNVAGFVWLLGFAALCVAGMPSAHAESVTGSSTTVRFGDLNLQQPEGAQELYRRIQKAARKVCRQDAIHFAASLRSMKYCIDTAVANAVDNVDNQNLTALHSKKRKGTFG